MRFYDYANVLIQGPSGSGKSVLIQKIINEKAHMFFTVPTKIIFVYSSWQPIYDELSSSENDITFMKHIPNESQLSALCNSHSHSILVLDDKMTSANSSQLIGEIFVRLSHHLKISTFCLFQGSHLPSQIGASHIVRNAHYTILLKSGQMFHLVKALGTRIGDYVSLMSAYKSAVENKNFAYLVVSTHPRTPDFARYTTNILHSERPAILYLKKK